MLIGCEELDLGLTLVDSAQCFRWVKSGEWFGCALDGRAAWLRRTPEGIEAEGDVPVGTLRDYLDLDRDYAAVAAEYAHIPEARRAIELFPGMRVMNQPPWEALISFILSANNNVRRIRGLVSAISARYGEAVETPRGTLHSFPTPERLASASEDELRAMKLGYRAPFLIGAARRVMDGFPLEGLCEMPYEEAHALLTALPGVGDKVADCTLLFGCRHAEAFPVDVWVARLLESWFGLTGMSRKAMAVRARQLLGGHAGLMQQFLFHAARVGAIELD